MRLEERRTCSNSGWPEKQKTIFREGAAEKEKSFGKDGENWEIDKVAGMGSKANSDL